MKLFQKDIDYLKEEADYLNRLKINYNQMRNDHRSRLIGKITNFETQPEERKSLIDLLKITDKDE